MKIKLPIRKPGPPRQRPPQLKLKASVARSRRAPIIEEEDFLEEPEPNMRLSHAFVVVLVLHVIAVAGVFAFNSIKAKQADIFSAINDESSKTAATAPEAATAGNTLLPEAGAPDPSNGPSLTQPAAQAPAIAPAATAKTHELLPGETLTKVASTYGVSVEAIQTANNITDPTKIPAGTVLTIPADAAAAPAPATYKPIAVAPAPAPAAPVAPAAKAAEPKPAAHASASGGVKDSGKIYVVVKGDNPVRIAKNLKVPYADLMSLNGNPDPRKLQIGQKLKIPATGK